MIPGQTNTDFTLEWWIEGKLVSTVLTPESGDGFVYFCETCGKAWAARYFPNRATIRFYGACAGCPPSRGEVPGSLILWWHDEMERMPAVLVEREYEVHINHYLKETEHGRDTLERKAA